MTALDTKALLVGVTPGDWEAAGWRIMGDGQQVAGCELMLRAPIEEGEAETRQNARLIASAPRLARRVIELEEQARELLDMRNVILACERDVTVGHLIDIFGWHEARAALTIQGEGA